MKDSKPRKICYFGRASPNVHSSTGETWIEAEEACYPSGRMLRRARVLFPDGKRRIVQAGIPDTFFSIPAHGKFKGKYIAGYITIDDDGEFEFRPYQKKESTETI